MSLFHTYRFVFPPLAFVSPPLLLCPVTTFHTHTTPSEGGSSILTHSTGVLDNTFLAMELGHLLDMVEKVLGMHYKKDSQMDNTLLKRLHNSVHGLLSVPFLPQSSGEQRSMNDLRFVHPHTSSCVQLA